jgi:hypothetical protein
VQLSCIHTDLDQLALSTIRCQNWVQNAPSYFCADFKNMIKITYFLPSYFAPAAKELSLLKKHPPRNTYVFAWRDARYFSQY